VVFEDDDDDDDDGDSKMAANMPVKTRTGGRHDRLRHMCTDLFQEEQAGRLTPPSPDCQGNFLGVSQHDLSAYQLMRS